jgi:peptidyl-prolyl cis-trans isomerase D
MAVILGLIAVSFAIWGIGDIFRGFGQSTVATVGSTEIRIDQFRQLYQDRMQQLGRNLGRPILPDQARALGLDRQVLMQMITETMVDEQTRALRLGISDAEIARRITEDPNFRSITGQFDRLRFEQALRNAGYSEARFLDEQHRNILRKQLVGTIGGNVIVPKAALEAFHRFQNEERAIDYFTLERDHAGDIPAPTPEVLAKYFEERKVLFRAPEYRRIMIVELTPDELASTIEVSDADVKKAYEERKERYLTPERRHVKQIVFPNMEEARAAAEKIAKGMTFDALAAERNLKESDIDLGTIAKSAIVDRAVADAAFALKVGEVSDPVEGRFGIALLQVAAVEPAHAKPLDEAAGELKRQLALERARNEVQNVEEKVEDERLGGANLADAARKFNLKPRTIEAVDRSGRDPDGNEIADLPKGVDLLASAFVADVSGENEPLRLPGNGYVWYDVLDIKPSRERSLDQVKDQVLSRWREEEVAARLKTKANEMLDQLKAGRTFAEVATASNVKVEWRPGIKRGSPPPGFPARAMEEIFRTPKDAAASVEGTSPTERIVFRVSEVKVPPLDPQSADARRLEEALRRGIADDIAGQYVAHLQSEIGFRINQNALNQVTGGGPNF